MNRSSSKIRRAINLMATVVILFSMARAQQDAPSGGQQSGGAVPAATGPDTATQTIENPPLSGLDSPSFEPGFGARSYLLFKAQLTEAADTNATSNLGSSGTIRQVTQGLGSVSLQKMWKVHPLAVDYAGGAYAYHGKNGRIFQNHALSANQRFLWRTGQLALRDSFSYLPQGSFGFGSFGGAGGFGGGVGGLGGGVTSGGGIAGGGGGGIFTNGQFGSVGNQPRISNMGIVDVTQSLSPRSSVVVAGGYGITDFLNNPAGYVNSNQTIGQAGYNYQLSRKDQIAFTYAFEEFHFPRQGSGSINANVWQALYGHRISGKLDVSLGGGPQWIRTYSPGLGVRSYISGSGRASLTYHVSTRTNMILSYSHYTNPGSGFFVGANTDDVRYSLNHALTRRWSFMTDTGYSRSSRILSVATKTANNAQAYSYWYAGGGLHWQLSRQFGAFTSYQYDKFGFGSGFCSPGSPGCGRTYDRHMGVIGIDWTPGPIRLD
jgi:hypothetical protein